MLEVLTQLSAQGTRSGVTLGFQAITIGTDVGRFPKERSNDALTISRVMLGMDKLKHYRTIARHFGPLRGAYGEN